MTSKQWGVVRDFVYNDSQGVLRHTTAGFTLSQSYTWDSEGRMSTNSYPSLTVCGYAAACQSGGTVAGPAFSYGYDMVGRLLNMTRTDVTPSRSVADTAVYNEGDQLVSYTANNTLDWEQRQYDTLRRLTGLRIGGGVPTLNVAYNYTAGYSPGKITSMTDSVANQTVSYSYDSLNRLAAATATGGSGWNQTYSYDGFGNLTGNGNWSQSVNAASNQISNLSYDANGNQTQSPVVGQSGNATLTYDVENRLAAMVYGTGPPVTIGQYAYNPANQRVWRQAVEGGVTVEYFFLRSRRKPGGDVQGNEQRANIFE